MLRAEDCLGEQLVSPTQNTSDAVVALHVTLRRNDLCLRTSLVTVQSMALTEHPPTEWQITLPEVKSFTSRGAGPLPVCGDWISQWFSSAIPQWSSNGYTNPKGNACLKGTHTYTHTHICCSVLQLHMLTHRKFYSWNRALRFAPLSRDTAVRARVPRTPGCLGFVWNSVWEAHQNIPNTPPQTAPSSWRCRLSLSRTASIFNDNVQVWTTKSHRNNEASKLVWVFLSSAGTCL